jgi:pilus assembly protein Flp/PilA
MSGEQASIKHFDISIKMGRTFCNAIYIAEIWQQQASRGRDNSKGLEGTPLMSKLVGRFLRDDSGATAIEYGLIAAGISVAIIVAVNTLGTNLNTTFSSVSSQLK